MAQDLGPPGMFKAAETIVNRALAKAQTEAHGNHYLAFKAVLAKAGGDATLTGAIIFLHLGYALEAINRAEASSTLN